MLLRYLDEDEVAVPFTQDDYALLQGNRGLLVVVTTEGNDEFDGVVAGEMVACGIVNIVQIGRGRFAKIDDIVTDPRARGHYIGTYVMRMLMSYAERYGVKRIELTCSEKHAAAIPMYLGLGFKEYETDVFRYDMCR